MVKRINSNNQFMKDHSYIVMNAVVLYEESRKLLLEKFPPKFEMIYAHHMTINHGVREYHNQLGDDIEMTIIGHVHDKHAQCVIVQPHEFELITYAIPHITVSTELGIPPVYSNELISKNLPWIFNEKIIIIGRVMTQVSTWVDCK